MTKKNITMGINEVASVLDISPQTLRNKRSANDDLPPARKFGKKLIWLREEVEEWVRKLPYAA